MVYCWKRFLNRIPFYEKKKKNAEWKESNRWDKLFQKALFISYAETVKKLEVILWLCVKIV